MRTTVRIDDELLRELKEQARRENVSLTRLVNRTLQAGLHAARRRRPRRTAYREQTMSMGPPRVNLDKALALAAALEDAEITRRVMLRK